MEVFLSFVSILMILALIVLACVVFTNAVEHLGEELNLSEGAVGSVLAAVGTALPETIVPLVAIIGAYIAGTDRSNTWCAFFAWHTRIFRNRACCNNLYKDRKTN